jgi:hypothetical protein
MYKPKINKETILELSLDLLEVIKKKIKEELNGQGKDKKSSKGLRRNSSSNPD